MHVLDLLDKKILYELGNNARLSYKKIASRIRSKKPVVAYRINNMEKDGIIWKYVPVFSLSRLGIYSYKLYFKLKGLDEVKEKEIVKKLVLDKDVCWVAKAIGSWDLLIAIYAKDLGQFSERKNKIFSILSNHIQEYSISMIEDALVFNRDYLIEKPTLYRKEFVFGGDYAQEKIDDNQKEICRLIFNQGKFSAKDLASKLNLNPRTIISKVRDLEKKKIIQGYTTFIHPNRIGVQFCKIGVYLSRYDSESIDEVVNYSKLNPNVLHLIKSLGDWELELELEAENVETIYDFIKDLKTRFPDIIKKIDLTIIRDELKLDFFPDWY